MKFFIDTSVRHPMVLTCPRSVLLQLCKHPLPDLGLARFLSDWEQVPT